MLKWYMMMDTNYLVDALEILLREDCLIERYHPLIPQKAQLISAFRSLGCRTKNEVAGLSDEQLAAMGVSSVPLLRRFLALYDPDPKKFREIEKADPQMQPAFRELFLLPGVRSVRAELYYRSGYRSLKDFADAVPEEVLERTARTIERESLPCAAPLPKEVRTHIAVAKAFTGSL